MTTRRKRGSSRGAGGVSPPRPAAPERPVLVTLHLEQSLLDRSRRTAYRCSGPERGGFTVTALVERGITGECRRLERHHNRGDPFGVIPRFEKLHRGPRQVGQGSAHEGRYPRSTVLRSRNPQCRWLPPCRRWQPPE
jgi:hypothetical protein